MKKHYTFSEHNMKYILGLFIAFSLAFPGYAATKTPVKVDCSVKKNANKLECKEAPKTDVKVEVKKPTKVDRKAPKSVQKKAEENNKK